MKKEIALLLMTLAVTIFTTKGQDVPVVNLIPNQINTFGDKFDFQSGTTRYGGVVLTKKNGTIFGDNNSLSLFTYDHKDLTFHTGTGNIIFFPNTNNSNTALRPSGNVGIGTLTPTEKLEIAGDVHIHGSGETIAHSTVANAWLKIGTTLGFDSNEIMFNVNGHLGTTNGSHLYFYTNAIKQMTISSGGNVGIGTSSPSSKLEIVSTGDLLKFSTDRPWVFRQTNSGSTSELDLHSTVSGKNFKITSSNNNRVAQFFVSDTQASNKVLLVPDGGSVVIGTNNSDSKLTVAGKIHSREVEVTVDAGADFVFEESYELRTLEETEAFLKKNNHLPEIQSENQMINDGLNLGEMDIKLLQKIEELTLYMIDMNKQVQNLKTENQDLKEKMKSLENE